MYTFSFSRFDQPTQSLHRKLLKAIESKSVLVCTSTSIKAFQLKFIEILHQLDQLHTNTAITMQNEKLTKKARREVTDEYHRIASRYKEQLEMSVRILRLFRTASLLIDEIDTVLSVKSHTLIHTHFACDRLNLRSCRDTTRTISMSCLREE